MAEETAQAFAFAARTLLEAGEIPLEQLAELALREGQRTNPLYRVHRWFARRLGSQFRAILTGLALSAEDADRFWETYLDTISLRGALVLDPFVGGGTSLVEARRCQARVIGYDIDPVATFITRFELSAGSYALHTPAIDGMCESLSHTLSRFHTTHVPGRGACAVLHHFWVERRTCHACGALFELHPHYQLAYSKDTERQWVFCQRCHQVYELSLSRHVLACACGARTRIHRGTVRQGTVRCPVCGGASALSSRRYYADAPPTWHLFAQEYLEQTPEGIRRHFKTATDEDRLRYDEAAHTLHALEASEGAFAPVRPLPVKGRADQRPLLYGFTRYRELFNARQLLHLTLLGRAITAMQDLQAQHLLTLAFSEHLTTNCMYTAYAFGYRRLSPLFAIHAYRHVTRPVELNPWLKGIGRGTFPNVLNKLRAAIAFAIAPTELAPQGGRRSPTTRLNVYTASRATTPADVLTGRGTAAVKTQSSEALVEIPDGVIDLILTDPPYFDNLSYSELSDFYLAWHQVLGIAEPPYHHPTAVAPLAGNLALPNRSAAAVAGYRTQLQRILTECWRVLAPQGICVFTYHHTAAAAWCALGEALARSGLRCTTVLPMRGEGRGLHSYHGTIKWDAVFVCRKDRIPPAVGQQQAVVVPTQALLEATRTAHVYGQRLARHEHIAFRTPDLSNLQRALLVAAAVVGLPDQTVLTLPAALTALGTQGETHHAQAR
jgi:adenine-specific DNA methylase